MRESDLLILGVLLTAFLFFKGRGVLASRRGHPPVPKAGRGGNAAARELLLKKGYQIVGVNERLEYQSNVSGSHYRGHLLADFLVQKEGKRLAVKCEPSGEQAALLTRAEGRGQLLPLQYLTGTAGVLVLDLENEKISTISYKIKMTMRQKEVFLIIFLSGAIAGAVAVRMIFLGGGF